MIGDKGTLLFCRMCNQINICVRKHTLIRPPLFILAVFWICSSLVDACKFPDYLHVDSPWTASYKNEISFRGYFREGSHGSYLKASKCNEHRVCTEYQRKCLTRVSADKFEVQHIANSGKEPHRYLCMQFIKRAVNIIQIKESHGEVMRHPESCNDDNLRLDHWPLVTSERFYEAKIPCPFSGGYNIRFHTSSRQPLCPRQLIPPRLESECEPGDGISINFRNKECMDLDLQMRVEQSLHCAAAWTHGDYTFIILRPQEENIKAWCLRIKGTDRNSPIRHGHLFMDLVCDPGGPNGDIRLTSKYLYMEFQQHVVSSICADQSNVCVEKRMCGKSDFKPHCPRTCRFCEVEPRTCPFPEGLRGEWMEKVGDEKKTVNISFYSLEMSDVGSFWCYETEGDEFRNNTMLLQTFNNGCFPRFACLEINKPTISGNMLEYRLGNRIGWPLKNLENIKSIVCDAGRFIPNEKDKERYGHHIADKPSKLLMDMSSHARESCELDQWSGFKDTQFVTQDDRGCNSCIMYDAEQPDTVIRVPINCTKRHHIKYRTYWCLAAFRIDKNIHAIVTNTLHTHHEYLCWIFVSKQESAEHHGDIYVTEATNCNKVVIYSVANGHIKPLHKYSIPKSPSSRCPYVELPKPTTTTNAPVPSVDVPSIAYTPDNTSRRPERTRSNSGTMPSYNVVLTSVPLLIALIMALL